MPRIFLTLLLLFPLAVGCGPKPKNSGSSSTPPHDHGHAHHGHDHEEEGPHGGHLIELGEEEYHVEWLHDDASGKLTFYILDGEAKTDVPISAESIAITVKMKDEAPQEYQALPVNAAGDPPQTAQFEITDPALVVALQIGEGVEASLAVTVGEKSYTAEIEHHDHEEHGHKH